MSFHDGWSYLLAPMGVEEFLGSHWEPQKPLYIPGHESKFRGLLDRESFIAAITGMPNDGKLQLRVGYTNPDDTGSAYGFFGGREALEHFERGATICATSLEHVEPRVRALRDALAAQWPSPDQLIVNCYYSPEGQGFGTHYDPQSVWVMQIEGRKRWFYSTERAVAFPSDGITAMELRVNGSPQLKAAESMQEVELKPGDVLYLPPGTWHRAEARGDSLALSVSQLAHGTRRLVGRLMRNHLLDREEFRRHFPLPVRGSAEIEPHLERLLAEMKKAVDSLTVADLRDLWAHMSLPRSAQGAPSSIGENDRVRVAAPLAAFVDERQHSVTVYRNQRKYDLPWTCRTLVARHGESFSGAEAASEMEAPWEDASPIIHDLLQIGVLVHA